MFTNQELRNIIARRNMNGYYMQKQAAPLDQVSAANEARQAQKAQQASQANPGALSRGYEGAKGFASRGYEGAKGLASSGYGSIKGFAQKNPVTAALMAALAAAAAGGGIAYAASGEKEASYTGYDGGSWLEKAATVSLISRAFDAVKRSGREKNAVFTQNIPADLRAEMVAQAKREDRGSIAKATRKRNELKKLKGQQPASGALSRGWGQAKDYATRGYKATSGAVKKHPYLSALALLSAAAGVGAGAYALGGDEE